MIYFETRQGSATSPTPTGGRGVIIAHICNSEGGWGAGFVLAVNDLSLSPREAYRGLADDHNENIPLGITQFVEAKPNIWVANMIAQRGLAKSTWDECLVDYKALSKCLKAVFDRALALDCDISMPAGMGSGLAGGDKKKIVQLVSDAAHNLIDFHEEDIFLTVMFWEFTDTTAASYIPSKSI